MVTKGRMGENITGNISHNTINMKLLFNLSLSNNNTSNKNKAFLTFNLVVVEWQCVGAASQFNRDQMNI